MSNAKSNDLEQGSVDYLYSDFVVNVVFNQPKRHNAMSLAMWQQLAAHMDALAPGSNSGTASRTDGGSTDDASNKNAVGKDSGKPNTSKKEVVSQPRVVVFTGAGEKSFVSGSDISEFKNIRSGEQAISNYNKIAASAEQAVYDCTLPTIAKINGYCMGGGLGIAMSCDLRLCSSDASFALPAAQLGLGYEFGAVCKLFDLLGPTATSQLFYSGKRLSANEALELGLVSEIVPGQDLDSVVDDLASNIARQAPLTLKAYKAALLEYRKSPAERNVAAISGMVNDCYRSEDYAEGQAAFREKRPPVFKGI